MLVWRRNTNARGEHERREKRAEKQKEKKTLRIIINRNGSLIARKNKKKRERKAERRETFILRVNFLLLLLFRVIFSTRNKKIRSRPHSGVRAADFKNDSTADLRTNCERPGRGDGILLMSHDDLPARINVQTRV